MITIVAEFFAIVTMLENRVRQSESYGVIVSFVDVLERQFCILIDAE
jgi:hypothetical protein